MLNDIINAIIQFLLFALIPFIWWFISARKQSSFLNWIGIKPIRCDNKSKMVKIIFLTLFFFCLLSFGILYFLKDVSTATSKFYGLGVKGILPAIIYSFIKTSLSEEILFRGFILKRLKNKFGFNIANAIQSTLFGLLHGVMFFTIVNALLAFFIVLFTGAIAWVMGYINEEEADGSILPSWIIHGLSNIFSSIISLFCIL